MITGMYDLSGDFAADLFLIMAIRSSRGNTLQGACHGWIGLRA